VANDRTRINRDDIRPDSISGIELKSDDSSLNKVTDGIMLIEGTGSNRNVTISRPLISSNDIIFSGSVRNIGTASNLNLNFITNNQVRMILQGDGNIRLGASGTASEKLDVDGNIKATKFIGPLEGNANTATKWATGRTISLTGGVTGSVSGVDGSGNISISTTLSPHSLASHTVSGLTPGHFLKALTATTFGFSPHGLTYSDVGAAPASHTHNYDNYQNWVLKVNSESTGVNIETKGNVNLIAGTNVTLSRSGTGVTISSADTKYTAGNGLTLSGTQFSLDAYTNAELTAGTMGEIGVNSTGAYVVLGENSKTAYRGDRGKAAYDHISSTGASHTYINQDVKTTASPTFAGLTLTGKLQVANSTTHAMLNIPRIGTADPTNYSAGDLWHRSNNLYYVDSGGTVRALAHTSSWSAMSQAEIETGTATSSRFMRADRLKYAVEYHAPVKSVAGKTGTVTLSSSDVGLGSVNNYGIASQAQAQAGTVNTVYMTPLRTKEAILALTPIPTWGSITDKPSTFPPSAHNHPWSQITDKPSTFEPSAHTHSASNITSGTLSVDRLPSATTSGKGIVQLSTSTSSTSTSLAATASAVKSAYDLANSKWTYNEATIKAVKVNSAGTADTLATARTINGTSFNGSANITTANWGTARTLTIGSTGKSVNGSSNVSWTLAEIGAAPASHSHQVTLTATLNTSGWMGIEAPFAQIQQVSGILATDVPIVDVVLSGDWGVDEARLEAWGYIYRITTSNNSITVYAREKPEVALPLQLKVVR